MRILLAAAGLAAFSACGPTIGDPCTTAAECGNQVCVNQDYTPGGYCSRQCTLADERSCPSGSTCVKDGLAKDNPACFRLCRSQADCRLGYVCKSVKDNPQPVCVGPSGI
ncbi:MAG: hypothetical protein HYZ28_25535 [Myxococcales bacterium]|nr:hypothetical protein [Myxococcales bacterium]